MVKNNHNSVDSVKKTIKIGGMHCNSCVKRIENEFKEDKNVSIKVDLIKNSAEVSFDPNKTDLNSISKKIDSLGYKTEVHNSHNSNESNPHDSDKSSKESDKSGKINNNATEKSKNWLLKGIMFGLIPHIGCIAFVVASIFGATVFANVFRPLLEKSYFFYGLIFVSIIFATISATIYLKQNGLLSFAGIKRKKLYLAGLYGSTIAVNLIFFFLIFPMLANASIDASLVSSNTNQFDSDSDLYSEIMGTQIDENNGVIPSVKEQTQSITNSESGVLKIKVKIPCSGHAPLITGYLKEVIGVNSVKYSFPDIFEIKYDSSIPGVTDSIVALKIFKEYPATIIN